MTDLLPCPFCGGSAYAVRNRSLDLHHVECNVCHGIAQECDTAEEAVTAWNRRAPVASGWRAIKSCPRDGTYVRVTYEDGEGMNLHRWSGETRGEWVHADGNAIAWQPLPTPFTGSPADLEVSGE